MTGAERNRSPCSASNAVTRNRASITMFSTVVLLTDIMLCSVCQSLIIILFLWNKCNTFSHHHGRASPFREKYPAGEFGRET